MPKVLAFAIAGVELFFWSNDHDPPHFHAEVEDEWEIKVHFLEDRNDMIEVLSESGPKGKLRRKILDNAEQFRLELLEQWESIHGQE